MVPKTSLICEYTCLLSHHLPIWWGLPLSLLSPCHLYMGTSFIFQQEAHDFMNQTPTKMLEYHQYNRHSQRRFDNTLWLNYILSHHQHSVDLWHIELYLYCGSIQLSVQLGTCKIEKRAIFCMGQIICMWNVRSMYINPLLTKMDSVVFLKLFFHYCLLSRKMKISLKFFQ